MHNHGCHLDNGKLHHREIEIKLLEKTMTALAYSGYKMKKIDEEFQTTYYETHFKHFNNLLSYKYDD